jgi:hypothetical protein
MKTLLDDRDREAMLRRLALLTPTSRGRWGSFTVGAMLGHLCEATRMALGELSVRPRGGKAFRLFPVKHLLLYVVPFPRGAPSSPELLAGTPGNFEADLERLAELLRRLGTGPKQGAGPSHPRFGPLSRREWGRLVYKHTDHHLRQFNV